MTDYRIINIPKLEFEILKKYCDEHALNLSKWLVLIAKEKIRSVNEQTQK